MKRYVPFRHCSPQFTLTAAQADRYYHEKLTEIRTSSAVYQSRQQARLRAKNEGGVELNDEKDMRAATCAELQNSPSVPHPPQRSGQSKIQCTALGNVC